jgi:hypothetical protein
MEVYRTDEMYEVALSTYNSNPIVGNYVSIFNFDMSGTSPLISNYNVFIPGNEDVYRFVKGLEFSSDGLTLYATIMVVNHSYTSIVPGDNLVYFTRTSLGSPFLYGGNINLGPNSQDFGLGMIEKGNDGQLWLVRYGYFGALVDNNDPSSAFMDNVLSVNNQLSNATLFANYGQSNPPTVEDVFYRKMYLLVDQIDGEDYSLWMSVPDLYPSIISVTCFPFTFPYPIPPNANINYAGGVIWNYPTLELQSYVSTPLSIQFFNEYGCEHKENITVFYEEELWCDAEFDHTYTKAHSPNVPVSANCDYPGSTLHEYYLYQSDGQGGWILIDSCFTASCVLTGLQINQNYKIVHDVYNSGSSCHPFDTTYHLLSTF